MAVFLKIITVIPAILDLVAQVRAHGVQKKVNALFDGRPLDEKYDTACGLIEDASKFAKRAPTIYNSIKRDFDMIEQQYIKN